MTNLDRILKSRDITLPTKAHLVQAMVFPVVMYGCESWTVKKAEHRGLVSFRMDWLDLCAVQGTLKSLLQHHSSKASIFHHSAFFTILLSHPYITTGKTIALTRRTFVGKVMSLLLNMLSGLVITFLLKEEASFKFMSAITIGSDSGAQKNKVSHCFPIYLPLSDGTRCHGLCFLNVEL